MTDQQDPLAGRDPYPREQIDVLGLHRERAELLEEIVSTPGPGATAPSTRTKVLMSVGIAAALAVVGGGVWFATGGDGQDADDPVVAASSPAASEEATATDATDATDEPSTTAPTDEPKTWSELRKGDVLTKAQCRQVRLDRERPVTLRMKPARGRRAGRATTLESLLVDGDKGVLYVFRDGKRWIGVDQDCTVRGVGEGGRDWIEVYVKPRPRH